MSEMQMPDGEYLSLSGMIRAGTGGQTRALLMRNRLFAQHAGIRPTLLTFDASPVYPDVRKDLQRMGQLVDGMRLLNIYEYFRTEDLSHQEPTGGELSSLANFDAESEMHPDGGLYRTVHVHRRSRDAAVYDYHRADGSRYLRVPVSTSVKTRASPIVLLNEHEQPIRQDATLGGLYRFWVRWLTPEDRRAFIISDSRFALAHLVPFKSPRFHVMHLMHNTHTVGERRWNSNLASAYGTLLSGIRHLDGLVTLTHRQREDVIARYGETNNLFVVPNPVEIPPLPEHPEPRASRRFVIVSRLEDQKRLEHAVQIFARVLERVPDAKLDIYGDGSLRVPLEQQIAELGVGHAVVLRGHDPRARETLWTATAFLMTSKFEGYPLATLESMSRGCPVISYDIKYGPREQIIDGVDGFVVGPGDMDAFADRIVQMVENPDLVASMSEAALKKANRHDYNAFLSDWKQVIEAVVAQKSGRVKVESVDLKVTKLGFETSRILARVGKVSPASASTFRTPKAVRFAATLGVRGGGKQATLETATVNLDAICDATAAMIPIRAKVSRKGKALKVSAAFNPEQLFDTLGRDARTVRIRITVVWQNYSWSTAVVRPVPADGNYEVSFDDRGALRLQHHTSQG